MIHLYFLDISLTDCDYVFLHANDLESFQCFTSIKSDWTVSGRCEEDFLYLQHVEAAHSQADIEEYKRLKAKLGL